jgi:hypothetical protein
MFKECLILQVETTGIEEEAEEKTFQISHNKSLANNFVRYYYFVILSNYSD